MGNREDSAQTGKDAADIWLDAIYQEYGSSLYRYALALTCVVEDAQDAVQDIFARISRDRKRFLEVKDVKAYLFSSTRNAAYSILRRRMRVAFLNDMLCADIAAVVAPTVKPTSVTIMLVRDILAELSIEQREVVVLKILNQMTFKEIASTVKASVNTVAARYRYAVIKLRKSLEAAAELPESEAESLAEA
jgi:RNA polymerase sigma factor (sigma-70 family)